MSLPIPLTVRLSTTRRDIHVTGDLRDLSFREVVPGGFASCSLSLDRPLALQPDEIIHFGKVYVYDARTGAVVWEGWLEDPGRGVSGDGQVWRLAAIGPSTHTKDRTIPLIYVDKLVGSFTRIGQTVAGMDTAQDTDGSNNPGWRLQLRNGTAVPANTNLGGVEYLGLSRTDQALARISLTYDMGNSDTAWRLRGIVRSDFGVGSGTVVVDIGWTTTAASTSAVRGTDWTSGAINRVQYQIRRTSGVTVADDITYELLTAMVVRSTLYNAAGTELTSGSDYTLSTVYAHEIVRDLLGRLLTRYDGSNASIALNTFDIDHLAYPDGVTAHRVLEDLMRFERDHYWAAWESSASGLHRFEWTQWPAGVRYEAEVSDGYASVASGADLYDKVRVRYRQTDGAVATVQRTQTVTALTNASRSREALLDLGDEAGSLANAQQAGDEFLAEHARPHNAGRLTIARPILDIQRGRMVQPWEIRAGTLIRVRGILPRPDALNATARDGTTVFRIVGREYSASTGTATLELDSFTPSIARIASDWISRPDIRRR